MKITYRHYQLWMRLSGPVTHLIEAITNYLWHHAHYKNGSGSHLQVPPPNWRWSWQTTDLDRQP